MMVSKVTATDNSGTYITLVGSTSCAQDTMPISKKFIGAVEDEWQLYSDSPADYTIGSPIGFGASSIVYSAVYRPSSAEPSSPGIPCALKVLDLDTLAPRSLQLLQRETTLMSLSKHPKVLRVRGSWVDGHRLYIAFRLMNKGSAADVMRYGWPGGMEEDVVRCILSQALSGLNYLHVNGFIHRDIKAANLLIDDDGTVLVGDLGVAADITEDTSHKSSKISHFSSSLSQPNFFSASELGINSAKHAVPFSGSSPDTRPHIGKRKSFVGTPCWMAPEVIERRQYDSSADIWSFGITALELTQGRPPKYRDLPSHALLRIIQEDPPSFDRQGGVYKYSRAFKEIVDSCLVKDPLKRPTAEELLRTPFFRAAKDKSYLVGAILKDLPPLTQRQERRVVPRITLDNSVASWDFPTTPLANTHRSFSEEIFAINDRENLNISFLSPDAEVCEQGKRGNDLSASSGTSNSSINSITTESTSLPSSYAESMGSSCGDQENLSSEPNLPAPSPCTPNPQFMASPTITPTTLTNQQGLWRKIKNNVRPSSSGSDVGGLGNSPRRERGKFGSIFTSSKSLLSSRSSPNVV